MSNEIETSTPSMNTVSFFLKDDYRRIASHNLINDLTVNLYVATATHRDYKKKYLIVLYNKENVIKHKLFKSCEASIEFDLLYEWLKKEY